MLAFNTKPVPHFEARKILEGKPIVTREVFDQLPDEIQADAFTITGIEDFDVLQGIRDRIADLPAGANWDDIKKDIIKDMSPWFSEKGAERRAEILLHHHGFSAYAKAQARVMDELADVFPFRQYISTEDSRVRPSHAALNGIILKSDHHFWHKHTPPWEWNCRCDVVELTGEDMEEERGKDADRPLPLQRVLEGPALKQLDQGQINRGPATNIDIRTPKERGGNYENNVRAHGIDYSQIRHRWDKETRTDFEAWADQKDLNNGSLLDRLLNKPPKSNSQPKPTPSISPPPVAVSDITTTLTPIAGEIQTLENEIAKLITGINDGDKSLIKPRKKISRLRKQRDEKIEKARTLVEIPTAQRGKVKLTTTYTEGKKQKTTSAPVVKTAKDGAAIVERYTHPDLMPEVTVRARAGRAYYHPTEKTLYISSKSGASTAAHEITHGTEIQDPDTLKKSLTFLKVRSKGQAPVSLRQLTGANYPATEVAYEDDWAKLGGHPYSGKDYNQHASELLTMGIERLHKNPAAFASQDPDYFQFVITTLQKR